MMKRATKANVFNLPVIQEVDESTQIFLKKQWFIQAKKQAILQRYSFANKIGQGAFGEVFKATLFGTDLVRAIKVIKKHQVAQPSRLVTQITLMKQLDHPNLVKLYQTYQTNTEIFLVMEYCEGGQLFSKIENGKRLSETEAKEIFRDMVKVINYLHSCNVCHRDLKPENFLFLDKRPGSILKLTDFGLSRTVSSGNKLKSMVGTVYYISPQVLESEYDISCDVWSLGVLLIVLLSGSAPFEGQEDWQIMKNIVDKNAIIPKDISVTAKNLISRCLMPANKRIKTSQILQHPWLIDRQRRVTINKKLDVTVLRKYSESNKLKKLILTIIASQVKSKEIEEISKLFKSLDVTNEGQLKVEQIIKNLKKNQRRKYSQSELIKIIDGIDTDKNGTIGYTQFLAATMDENIYLKPKYLKLAFDLIDKDKSGTIEFEQLKELLMPEENSNSFHEKEWRKMVKQLDKNGDGVLSFEEFVTLFET